MCRGMVVGVCPPGEYKEGGYKENTLKILFLKAKYMHLQKAHSVLCTSACHETFWFPKGS